MIISDEAIVIRCVNYSNSSQVAELFTPNYGKIGIIAKGSRKQKPSPTFSGPLEVLTHASVVFYKRPAGTLAVLKEYATNDYFYSLRNNLRKLFHGFYFAELINEFTVEQDRQPELFFLLLYALESLAVGAKEENIRIFFQNKLLHFTGSLPYFEQCGNCKRSFGKWGTLYCVEQNDLLCQLCKSHQKGPGIYLGGEAISLLQYLRKASPQKIGSILVSSRVQYELEMFFKFFFQNILQKQLRTEKYLNYGVVSRTPAKVVARK